MSNLTKVMSENINSQKRFLTPSELEAEYGFSKSWQGKSRMISNPCSIPYIKLGSFIRYDRHQIDKWLENHTVKGVLS